MIGIFVLALKKAMMKCGSFSGKYMAQFCVNLTPLLYVKLHILTYQLHYISFVLN